MENVEFFGIININSIKKLSISPIFLSLLDYLFYFCYTIYVRTIIFRGFNYV